MVKHITRKSLSGFNQFGLISNLNKNAVNLFCHFRAEQITKKKISFQCATFKNIDVTSQHKMLYMHG